MKKKRPRPQTPGRGAADLAARFIAHAKRCRDAAIRTRRINLGKSDAAVLKAVGAWDTWNSAIDWMSQWNERASKRPGGLGRKRKQR